MLTRCPQHAHQAASCKSHRLRLVCGHFCRSARAFVRYSSWSFTVSAQLVGRSSVFSGLIRTPAVSMPTVRDPTAIRTLSNLVTTEQ